MQNSAVMKERDIRHDYTGTGTKLSYGNAG
jgi:hypothetical protein